MRQRGVAHVGRNFRNNCASGNLSARGIIHVKSHLDRVPQIRKFYKSSKKMRIDRLYVKRDADSLIADKGYGSDAAIGAAQGMGMRAAAPLYLKEKTGYD